MAHEIWPAKAFWSLGEGLHDLAPASASRRKLFMRSASARSGSQMMRSGGGVHLSRRQVAHERVGIPASLTRQQGQAARLKTGRSVVASVERQAAIDVEVEICQAHLFINICSVLVPAILVADLFQLMAVSVVLHEGRKSSAYAVSLPQQRTTARQREEMRANRPLLSSSGETQRPSRLRAASSRRATAVQVGGPAEVAMACITRRRLERRQPHAVIALVLRGCPRMRSD